MNTHTQHESRGNMCRNSGEKIGGILLPKPFIYAGKWVRSEQSGFGDGGDYWEVFIDDTQMNTHK